MLLWVWLGLLLGGCLSCFALVFAATRSFSMGTPMNANTVQNGKMIWADNSNPGSLSPGDVVEYGLKDSPHLAVVVSPLGDNFATARVRSITTGKEFSWHRNWFKRDPFRTAVHKRRNPEVTA